MKMKPTQLYDTFVTIMICFRYKTAFISRRLEESILLFSMLITVQPLLKIYVATKEALEM